MTRLVVALLLVAACKKDDPGPPCPQVQDHVLELMKQGLTGHDAVQLGNRKQMIDLCEQRPFSKETRTCLLAAKDLDGLARCQQKPARPPAPPPPAGSAGSGSIEPH
jgi:hypothetical protein